MLGAGGRIVLLLILLLFSLDETSLPYLSRCVEIQVYSSTVNASRRAGKRCHWPIFYGNLVAVIQAAVHSADAVAFAVSVAVAVAHTVACAAVSIGVVCKIQTAPIGTEKITC